jgi:hypothetical protein
MVRRMFDFRIDNYDQSRDPTTLMCYPLDLYVDKEGNRGEAALRRTSAYRDRRESFLKYTVRRQQSSSELLKYSGDIVYNKAFADDPWLFRAFLMQEGDSRAGSSNSKLVKVGLTPPVHDVESAISANHLPD